MRIIIATGNNDKFAEISNVLNEFGIASTAVNVSTAEHGSTLEAVVVNKARQAFFKIKKPLIVDDTGIYFTALKNFPGVESKRIFQRIGYEGLFQRIAGKNRDAMFRTLICYINGKTIKMFDGILKGIITEKVYEGGGEDMPYDRIFIPEGFDKPFCYFSIEEKNKLSHRAKAVRKFAEFFISVNSTT